MNVRQYIGARYVPRFLGIWNNTTQYEALDVVDNGSGTSYIARKIVPAGTPLNNTDFWFVYGASSGAIIDLQNRMGAAENDIDALQDVVFSDISDKKFIFISDSYGNYKNATDANMIDVACAALGITNYEDVHQGSIGFGTTPTNYATLLNNATSDDCDYIVAIGQANDMIQTISNISNGFSQFNTVKNTKYPNAKVIVLSLSTSFVAAEYAARNETIAEYEYECGAYGYDYYNALHTLSFNSQFRSDLVHPTAESVNILGRCIATILRDKKPITGEVKSNTVSPGSYFTNGTITHGDMIMSSTPAGVSIRSSSITQDYENAISITGDSRYVSSTMSGLFTTPNTFLRAAIHGKYGYSLPVRVFLIGANVYEPGIMYVSNVTPTSAEWSVDFTLASSVADVTGVIVYL